jgi:IS4 transposase
MVVATAFGSAAIARAKWILVTTLLDPHAYPAEKLAELYAGRWQVEVNLRHLKQTLHLKTVVGVHK